MCNELEKIDILRERFHITYEEAQNALNATGGDLVAALVNLEKKYPHENKPDLLSLGADIASEVKRLISGGPIRRLKLRYGNKLISDTPVTLSAALALVVGLAAVIINKLAIEVEKED
jgi:hypothetical protein